MALRKQMRVGDITKALAYPESPMPAIRYIRSWTIQLSFPLLPGEQPLYRSPATTPASAGTTPTPENKTARNAVPLSDIATSQPISNTRTPRAPVQVGGAPAQHLLKVSFTGGGTLCIKVGDYKSAQKAIRQVNAILLRTAAKEELSDLQKLREVTFKK